MLNRFFYTQNIQRKTPVRRHDLRSKGFVRLSCVNVGVEVSKRLDGKLEPPIERDLKRRSS